MYRLNIESIEIKNFLSYGNYLTKFKVSDRGPLLILGKNGAGKSSFLSAFIWCLFGRVGHSPSPGDQIVNWFNNENCFVRINTKDGWSITRTRRCDNNSELIVQKDGDDATKSTNIKTQQDLLKLFNLDYEIFISSVFCDQISKSFLEMTPTKRKESIERLLGLDRMNEYAGKAKEKYTSIENKLKLARSTLELLETELEQQQNRIESVEEKFKDWNLNKQNRIKSLKENISDLEKIKNNIDLPDLNKLYNQWESYDKIKSNVEDYKSSLHQNNSHIQFYKKELKYYEEQIKNAQFAEIPDIEELKKAHEKADELEKLERKRIEYLSDLRAKKNTVVDSIQDLDSKIRSWSNRSGQKCNLCEQEIDKTHACSQIKSLEEQKQELSDKLSKIESKLKKLNRKVVINRPSVSVEHVKQLTEMNQRLESNLEIAKQKIKSYNEEIEKTLVTNQQLEESLRSSKDLLEESKPNLSLKDAKDVHSHKNNLNRKIRENYERIKELSNEDNPYNEIIDNLQDQLKQSIDKKQKSEQDVKEFEILFSHYKYIYRSYSDRRKIKKWLLSELIPYLNDRIAYYLSHFDINIKIKFTSTLSNETDRWSYNFCSGGEKKKIDLSIMFALYDLYISLYGHQCNFMVLDEVDSRLDDKGVQAFVDLIMNNFNKSSHVPETILVISHKSELKDLFPNQLTVIKKEDSSFLDDPQSQIYFDESSFSEKDQAQITA